MDHRYMPTYVRSDGERGIHTLVAVGAVDICHCQDN